MVREVHKLPFYYSEDAVNKYGESLTKNGGTWVIKWSRPLYTWFCYIRRTDA